MPIPVDGKEFESFEDAVRYLMKTKGYSRDTAEKIVGRIEQNLKQAKAALPEFYEQNGEKYAKFFLINDDWSQNDWRVTTESIQKNIHTFEGMPFTDDPTFEHFGMNENSSVSWILNEQEKWRIGNIEKTGFDKTTNTAYAVVKFDNTERATKIFEEMKKGEAFYVSPAITGIPQVDQMGRRTYDMWHGLHLERVKNPAYGVMAATLKETCEGPGSQCINQLLHGLAAKKKKDKISYGSESDNSFNTVSHKACDHKMSDAKSIEEQIKEMQTSIASIKDEIKKLTENTDKSAKTDQANDNAQVNDNDQANKKQDKVFESANKKLIESLQAQIAALQNEKKEVVAVELADLRVDAELVAADKHQDTVAELMKLDYSALQDTFEKEKPLLQKIISMKASMPKSGRYGNSYIQYPATSSLEKASKDKIDYSDMDQLENMGLI